MPQVYFQDISRMRCQDLSLILLSCCLDRIRGFAYCRICFDLHCEDPSSSILPLIHTRGELLPLTCFTAFQTFSKPKGEKEHSKPFYETCLPYFNQSLIKNFYISNNATKTSYFYKLFWLGWESGKGYFGLKRGNALLSNFIQTFYDVLMTL